MTKNSTDGGFVNELFVLNFGRGRRFRNLYTSYQVGGFILNRNNDEENEFIPTPNLGVELVKTRHILLDTTLSCAASASRRQTRQDVQSRQSTPSATSHRP
ncbi:hypothetical protein [Hymenobacter elongatus]|uniref:Uncharacterized protein n=1 Tax=Hymenobacter elongatus TaxID=877208 RepID=A0A4Z0PNV4_9BACT|nr:hypothetical protein [Hymenobacter elongatus]TGE18615.1 hypothetical protein E5J99_04740 [Hymenobacter elongatus]